MGNVLAFPGPPPPDDEHPGTPHGQASLPHTFGETLGLQPPSSEDIADFLAMAEALDNEEGAAFWATVIRLRATLGVWLRFNAPGPPPPS